MSVSDIVVSRVHVTLAVYSSFSSPRKMDPLNVATPALVAADVEPLISSSCRASVEELVAGAIVHSVGAISLVTGFE